MFCEDVATKKEKVTFTCTTETKQQIEAWADREGRTVSNLVERIVLAALQEEMVGNKDSK